MHLQALFGVRVEMDQVKGVDVCHTYHNWRDTIEFSDTISVVLLEEFRTIFKGCNKREYYSIYIAAMRLVYSGGLPSGMLMNSSSTVCVENDMSLIIENMIKLYEESGKDNIAQKTFLEKLQHTLYIWFNVETIPQNKKSVIK